MKNKKKVTIKFQKYMKSKLVVFFGMLLACLCALIGRIMYIEYHNGEQYKKEVLSRQNYDSKTIPYQRGDILDTNGTVLATSIAVYNVILDCTVMTSDEDYIEPTISAILECFPDLGLTSEELHGYAKEEVKRPYIVLAKQLPYETVQTFVAKQEAVDEQNNKVNPNIKGVWFETEYLRTYPYGSLACDVLGFTASGNVGTAGLEHFYNDLLNGVNGREYGYLNSNSEFEKSVIEPENGSTIVVSIDENIQSIVEAKIREWNTAYTNLYREGAGADNIAVIIQNPNNGEIKAMASYPEFDLNNPRDMSRFYTPEQIDAMSDEDTIKFLNSLWQNYCVTATYEPGSVQKPFTVAAGIETGKVSADSTFMCDGSETISGSTIHCVKRFGHGIETVEGSLKDSCNDALMQMSYLLGAETFLHYQSVFGFGQKTGVDLPGEANTASLLRTLDQMTTIDLATNAFGQNYNCSMIQMVSAFSSLVNGGTYYEPHLLQRVVDKNGNTVSVNAPTVVKETVSGSTSDLLKGYLYQVVQTGTAKLAKVDGYSLGGKTGTAQKIPRGDGNYLVSFMGFAPASNPELVIYVVIDRPNVEDQPHSSYAQNLCREILKEVLPYMNIYPDEELTGVNANLNIMGVNPQEGGEAVPQETPQGE